MRHGVQQGADVDDGLHPLLMGQSRNALGVGAPTQVGLDSHEYHDSRVGVGIGQVKEFVGRPVNVALPVTGARGGGPRLGEVIEFFRIKLGELLRLELAL